jgi:sucrose-6-phosphate hydrolase SacC (GH32 family)
VIMARSEDSGATFFPWVNLSMTSAQGTPRIVAEDSNVYVVWVEPFSQPFKVVFRRSQNSGATFEDKIQVSTNTTTSAVRPALAASDSNVNNVNVAYTQGGQVYIAKLATGGLTFGPPTQLSTESCSVPPCSHDSANIAAAGMDDVHVTWRTANVGADGNDLAYLSYTRSIDGGVNYYAPQTVAQNLKNGDLAANGLNVYISWNDNAEVYMVHSSDRGNSFEPWINISNSSGSSGPFTVTVATPNEIHLTWGDSTPGNQDAFYRRGTVP